MADQRLQRTHGYCWSVREYYGYRHFAYYHPDYRADSADCTHLNCSEEGKMSPSIEERVAALESRGEQGVIPFHIHHGEHVHDSVWPVGFPIPRWGEGFHFQDEDFIIEDSEWRLDPVEFEGVPDNIASVALSYHIYLAEADEVEKEDLLPSRFK